MLTVRLRLGAVTLDCKEDEVFRKQVSESHVLYVVQHYETINFSAW